MEELSERLVRLTKYEIPDSSWTGNREISSVEDDVAIISISQDDRTARYVRMILELEEELLHMRDELTCFFSRKETPETFLEFLLEEERLLLGEVNQRPPSALLKTRRKRNPPPRISRRSSQVSPPIYLRDRFLPQSRKQSSFRCQR